MIYNNLDNEAATGLIYYIDDLNTRFTNLLFASQTDEVDDYKRSFKGLARLDINGIPHSNDETEEYQDSLFDDNYDLVSFYLESGDRKVKQNSFEAKLDLIVSVNMNKFTGYKEEGIINEVYKILKTTALMPETESRDFAALKGVVYPDKTPDSLYPYFVFKIGSKLLGDIN